MTIKQVNRCGRSCAAAVDQEDHIWMIVAWGLPYRFMPPILSGGGPDGENRIVDIECGWDHTCCLTNKGDVYIWWPTRGDLLDKYNRKKDEIELSNCRPGVYEANGAIECRTWDVVDSDPILLPSIPIDLPSLREGGKWCGRETGEDRGW